MNITIQGAASTSEAARLRRATLFYGSRGEEVPALTEKLSDLWGLPVEVEIGYDD